MAVEEAFWQTLGTQSGEEKPTERESFSAFLVDTVNFTGSGTLLHFLHYTQALRFLPIQSLLLDKAILPRLSINIFISQELEFFRRSHIANIFTIPFSEDDVNLLQGSLCGLRVGEVDYGEKASVDDGEEEVGSPLDVADHYGSYHYDYCERGSVLV